MQRFIDFITEETKIDGSFIDFDKDYQDDFIKDIGSYYVYFVLYRSTKTPGMFNLYSGVKHKESGGGSAKDFFGGIRHSTKKSRNVISFTNGETFFANYFSVYNENDNEIRNHEGEKLSGGDKIVYMTSCTLQDVDGLKDAYKKGLVDQDPAYHPLVVTKATQGKVIQWKDHWDHFSQFVKAWFSKNKKKVNEDASVSSQKLKNFLLPLEISKGDSTPGKLLDHAKSEKYGYRVYVCDNMNNYVEQLKIILNNIEEKKYKVDQDAKGLKEPIAKLENPEEKEKLREEVAVKIVIRHFLTLFAEFGEKLKYDTPQKYFQFILQQLKDYEDPLFTNLYEFLPQEAQLAGQVEKDAPNPEGKEVRKQKFNAAKTLTEPATIETYYCPKHFTGPMRKRAGKLFTGDEKENYKKNLSAQNRGKYVYDSPEEAQNDFEGEFSQEKFGFKGRLHQHTNLKNFSLLDEYNLKSGRELPDEEFSGSQKNRKVLKKQGRVVYKSCGINYGNNFLSVPFWNSEGNPLKVGFRKKKGKEVNLMKETFLKYDLKIMLHGHKDVTAKDDFLSDLIICILSNDTPHYVVKKSETELDLVSAKKVWDSEKEETIFTLCDFLHLIGYKKANPNDTFYKFVKSNNLLSESTETSFFSQLITEFAADVMDRVKSKNKSKSSSYIGKKVGKSDDVESMKTKMKKSREDRATKKKQEEEKISSSSSQPSEIDQEAIDFIKELVANPNQFKNIYLDKGSGERKLKNGKELLSYLFAPVRQKKK